MFALYGLVLFDAEEVPTHGGSLRIFARRLEHQRLPVGPRVSALRKCKRETDDGFATLARYRGFGEQVKQTSASCSPS